MKASSRAAAAATTFALLALLAFGAGCGDGDDSPGDSLKVTVSQGGKTASVRIEVAATSSERQQGLMLRQEMAEDAGMLFLFPRDVRVGFWMRNTYLPLDIAYISADGAVLEIRAAKPLDETVLTPAKPYRYVLEVNQGWLERHGLGVGAQVELPAGLPTATE